MLRNLRLQDEESWRDILGVLYLGAFGAVGGMLHMNFRRRAFGNITHSNLLCGTISTEGTSALTNTEGEQCVYVERKRTRLFPHLNPAQQLDSIVSGPYKVSLPSFTLTNSDTHQRYQVVLGDDQIQIGESLTKEYDGVKEKSIPLNKEVFILGEVEELPLAHSLSPTNNSINNSNNNNNNNELNKLFLKSVEGYPFVIGGNAEEVRDIAQSSGSLFLLLSLLSNGLTVLFAIANNHFYFAKRQSLTVNQYLVELRAYRDDYAQVEEVKVRYRFPRDENSEDQFQFNLNVLALLFDRQIIIDQPHFIDDSIPNHITLKYFSALKRHSPLRYLFFRVLKITAVAATALSFFSLFDVLLLTPSILSKHFAS